MVGFVFSFVEDVFMVVIGVVGLVFIVVISVVGFVFDVLSLFFMVVIGVEEFVIGIGFGDEFIFIDIEDVVSLFDCV